MGNRRWIGVIGALLYGVGFFLASSVPGGGDVDATDFEEFYVTDENTALPIIGVFLLTLGAIAILWFLYELREAMRRVDTTATFGLLTAGLGLAIVLSGACLLAGPSGVQAFSDEEFVGASVAHAFAQAGFAAMLVPGHLMLGAAVAIYAYSNGRAVVFPRWVAVAGYVAAILQLAAIIWIPFFAIPLWIILAAVFAGSGRAERTMSV